MRWEHLTAAWVAVPVWLSRRVRSRRVEDQSSRVEFGMTEQAVERLLGAPGLVAQPRGSPRAVRYSRTWLGVRSALVVGFDRKGRVAELSRTAL